MATLSACANLRIFQTCCICLVLVLAAGGCGGQKALSEAPEIVMEETTFSFDQGTYPSQMQLFPEYRIVPGDVLDVLFQIRTWQKKDAFTLAVDHTVSVKFVHAPELNETQQIQPDGKISLPYIGEIYVLGKTVTELTDELKASYGNVLRDAEIYVTVPEFRSRIKELKKDLHTAPRGLSRLVTVRPDGYATFPLTGDVFVAQRSLPEVKKDLDALYDGILPGLHVDLFLEQHAGSMLYVLGHVNNSGVYRIAKPVSVVEAIAMAGGKKPGARVNDIIVFRRHENKLVAKHLNLEKMLSPKDGIRFFYLRPDDVVYVPERRMAKLAQIMREVREVFFFRGWGIGIDGELYEGAVFD